MPQAHFFRPAVAATIGLAAATSAFAADGEHAPLPTLAEYAASTPAFLQAETDVSTGAEPGGTRVGTDPRDYRQAGYYARGAVMIWFPEDITFNDIASFTQQVTNPDDPLNPSLVNVPQDQDLTHGWGGGLQAALGYNFTDGSGINPRLEAEYQLLIVDYRDTNDDGITWNGLAVNLLVDFPVRDGLKLYGGGGLGMAYISYANPPLNGVGIGSDDAFTPYGQIMGGGLVRFSSDIDVDIGLRYQYTNPDAFEGDVELNNIIFHVGLLLHLE